jgi:glycosyltransferase involved in cell wall biosynthesis
MRCPRLDELPAPPYGKTGWPWTIETPPLPEVMPGGAPWPRISIVVASLNHTKYIEEMIRSILLQGYPDLELILIDGASNQGTLEVIAKYERCYSYWVSEPDRGQSHAFNKGLARATGDLFNIFDTDDYFLPGCFGIIAEAHASNPDHIVAGDVIRMWEGSTKTEVHCPSELDLHAYAQWWRMDHHGQPGLFYPNRHLGKVGNINEELHYSMDYDLTLRYLAFSKISVSRCPVAVMRIHAECKSVKNGDYCVWECMQISKTYQKMFPDIDADANRHAAGILFGFGFRRLLYGQGDSWKFMKEGLLRQPFWALYWLIPGWFLRKWSKLTAP